MTRFSALLLAGVSLLLACSGTAQAPPASSSSASSTVSASGYRVFVRASDSIHRLGSDPAAGAKLPEGVFSPDGKQLFATYGTDLRSFDPATGALTADLRLPDYYGEIAGQSPDGRYLALTGDFNGATRFASVSSRLDGRVRSAMLTNNFSFDALSEDGRWVYLIEKIAGPLDYRVRRYDLDLGRLDPNILVEKGAEPTAVMNGERYASVAVAAYSTVYSLYYGKSGAFVHALALGGGPIQCIDLPGPRALDPERQVQWTLALSPGHEALYAVNAAEGVVSRISLSSGKVSSNTFSPPAAPGSWWSPLTTARAKYGEGGTATVSPDGKTLFASALHGYVAIDTATLKLRGSYLTDSRVASLAATPDGRWLLAVRDDSRLVRITPSDGHVDGVLLSGLGPLSVLRVDPVS